MLPGPVVRPCSPSCPKYLFVETLRRYIALLPREQTGWLAGVRDPEVGKALALLHRKPAHPWTIAALANEVGISRSVLAERFRRYLSETPIAYLTRWRLQLGAQMLKSTSDSVAQIAAEVGYESEPSFNRAFKREFGLPPARFRSQSKSARSRAVRHENPRGVSSTLHLSSDRWEVSKRVMNHFPARGGDLVHLVSSVCFVCVVRRTSETRYTRAPDRPPLLLPNRLRGDGYASDFAVD